jgi:RNA polymerase sigma-70 factor (sigma-E family)
MTFDDWAAERLPALLRFAAVLTGDRALAEDVVQEVLIRAYGRWSRLLELDRPEAYIRRMIVNEHLSWRRRWSRYLPSDQVSHGPAAATVADHAAGLADRDALMNELARLPRRHQTVLVLRYYEGLTDNEIAAVLGCSPGTVRGYASRALASLRVDARTREMLGGQR